MKHLTNFFAVALMATILFSCDKDESPCTNELPEQQQSMLSVSIVPDGHNTKATGSSHGQQANDNNVETLEFFVFRNEGTDKGLLDTYKKFTASELTSGLTNLQIKTTTGAKVIYAIANSHKDSWAGIATEEQFKAVASNLKSENLKSFTMTGSTSATLQATSSVTITISRLVARVSLASVKTNFAGTVYEGSTLSNVKLYMLNVTGDKTYSQGVDLPSPSILNYKKYISSDCSACSMTGMLYDKIDATIDDSGYNTPHYFYCYENTIAAETADVFFTRFVIQADLNGVTYYYPINVNRDGFGYDSSLGSEGIHRNTSYSLNVVINRPGSLDPNKPVEYGAMATSVQIEDWITVPTVLVEF